MKMSWEKEHKKHLLLLLLPDMQWQHGGLWVDLKGVVGHVERCASSFKMFCISHLLLFVSCILSSLILVFLFVP